MEVTIEKAPESSLMLMIAAMMTIELQEKAWLVLVDQVLMTFMSQISVKMMATHNSQMIGEQLSRIAVDPSATEGEFHCAVPENRNQGLGSVRAGLSTDICTLLYCCTKIRHTGRHENLLF